MLGLRPGQRSHWPGREPGSGVRPGEARSARLRATQVRLPALPRRRGKPAAAGAADCSRHRRTRADRADRRRQVRRPPAALPSGRLLHAPRSAHRSQHPVRLGASGRGTVAAALRAAERAAAAIARAVDRRHARDVARSAARRGAAKGRFWTYIADEHPYSVYDFTESRARDGPASFLRGFEGYLHADAYGGYDHIFLGSNDAVREVACWAHARRKFFEAIHSSPREVHQILEWIRQLYDVEERARTWTEAARAALRQHEAEPVLDRIEAYLAQLERRALPKSVLAKAVSYAQNQWQALRRYTTDGRLSIDNNVSERTLRHQAIGRKNWLFLGSRQAGPRAAVLVHDPRRRQASPDRAVDLPARAAAAPARRRFASRRDAARQVGRQSPRIRAHLSARRIPPQSGRTRARAAVTHAPTASLADSRQPDMGWPDAYPESTSSRHFDFRDGFCYGPNPSSPLARHLSQKGTNYGWSV